MDICNTRSLQNDGQAQNGITGVVKDGLCLLAGNPRGLIPFAKSIKGSLPLCGGPTLIQAAGNYQTDMGPTLTGRNGWRGYVLKVSTFGLRFDESLSSYFGPIRNGWAGVEQVRRPFVQIGERAHADQHQLILINEGEWCVVADRGHRYMRVGCQQGKFVMRPAEKEELGAILVRRARARLTTLTAFRWTWHTLDQLGLLHQWTDDLQQRMDRLQRSAGA